MQKINERASLTNASLDCDPFGVPRVTSEHIAKIIKTYQFREEEARSARRVEMAEMEKIGFNLNISRYISTAVGEAEIDLAATHAELVAVEQRIAVAKAKHNAFLKELGLSLLP